MYSKRKKLIARFRAAARLANEWRDTIFYTTLTAYEGSHLLHGDPQALIYFWGASMGREYLRNVTWLFSAHSEQQLRLAGDAKEPMDLWLNSHAASAVSVFLLIPLQISLSFKFGPLMFAGTPFILAGCFMGSLGILSREGGLSLIPTTYRDILWDYPRKKGGNGPTQTQRMKESFKELQGKLIAAVRIPKPAMMPLPARSRNLTQGPSN